MTQGIEKAVAAELTLAYMQAGRSISDKAVLVVANSLSAALDFSDEEEVREAFRRARDVVDVPTQRYLKDALSNYRAERRKYEESRAASSATPRVEFGGSRMVSKAETRYIEATQALAGIYFGMDIETARRVAATFEMDPRNREMVDYQRGWIVRNAKASLAKLESMRRAG